MNILVVDDSPTMQRIIRTLLKQIGFDTVSEADTSEEGMKILERQQINLVIASSSLPKESGFELIRDIRAKAAFKGISCLMVTPSTDKKKTVDALKGTECAVIGRPFSLQNLREKILKLQQMETAI